MYVIKSNLPTEENGCRVERWLSRGMAVNSFLEHY